MLKKPKEKKKTVAPRIKKVKADLDTLPPAIFEGRFIVKVKGRVIFERTLQNKTEIHKGSVVSYDEEAGYVSLYDDTRGQCYGFDLNHPPRICAASEEDLIESLEMLVMKDDLARTKLHMRFLEEKLGNLFMIVKDLPNEEKKSS